MVRVVFWPLIGGFIALVLVTIIIGWVMDTGGNGSEGDGH
jgi:hypothetical protein